MIKLKRIVIILLAGIFILVPYIIQNENNSLATIPVSAELILSGGFDVVPDNNGNFYIFSYNEGSATKPDGETSLAYVDTSKTKPEITHLNFFTSNKLQDSKTTLNYKYSSVHANGNFLYITRTDGKSSTIERFEKLPEINHKVNLSHTAQIYNTVINAPQKIAIYQNNDVFFLKSDNAKVVSLYSMATSLSKEGLVVDDDYIAAVSSGVSKKYLYAATNDKLYRYVVDKNTLAPTSKDYTKGDYTSGDYTYGDYTTDYTTSGNAVTKNRYKMDGEPLEISVVPFKFLTDSIFITSSGELYTLDDAEFKLSRNMVKLQTAMENYPQCIATAGFDDKSIIAKTDSKTVSQISIYTGKVTGSVTFNAKVLAVSTSGNKTIVITGDSDGKSIHVLDTKSFSSSQGDNQKPNNPDDGKEPEEDNGGNNSGNKPNDDSGTTKPQEPTPTPSEPDNPTDKPNEDNTANKPEDDITSEEGYEINQPSATISHIPAGTNGGALKSGLVFDGLSTVIKDAKGNVKGTSAKLATGDTITFIKDGQEYKTMTIVVDGDVTGTGNVSSKSISALANHLLGKSELEGVFLDAANLSRSGELSTIDLLLMYKATQK